ncbi:Xaa-Pro peptidase family protein [Tropicimonas sp. IMCC34043]|uniref:M24 family metallopeptidase n=1 Tax=Tropicimonas sp. IMCC34043 TaxID=2248760 RepID=UPI001E608D3B|nr:Xaa-Pro peptidase family protein [Tropicimonas sp. IMCC34043]
MNAASGLRPLSAGFHANMRDKLRQTASDNGLDGHLMLRPSNIAYACGFFYAANERPVGLWLPVEGDPILFIPELERENAESATALAVRFYTEFPGETHPLLWMLDQIGLQSLSLDQLDALLLPAVRDRVRRLDLRDFAMEQRYIKTPEEIALTRAAAGFADLFLSRLSSAGGDIIAQGGTEVDLLNDAMAFARGALMTRHRVTFAGTPMGITATVHSGPRAALPHGAVLERRPQPGETLIAGIGASLGGYHAESGATFVIGHMKGEQRRIMQAMQDCDAAAVAALVPAARCDLVNDAAQDVLRAADLADAIRHRIGHGMGLDGHEAPWLAPGDKTRIAPGMVFSNEPGVYRPGLDGYRTINTMIVTPNGVEIPSRFQAETPIDARIIAL